MDFLAKLAEGFIGLFEAGGENFMGLVTGIIPTLVVLITFVNSIVQLVGQEKVENFARKTTKYAITRYTIFPIMAVFFLTNPMAYTFGRFLEEKYKPPFIDAALSFVHPITGLFPHANAAELFVWIGISDGVIKAGYPTGDLAVRYFLSGIVVIFLRGIITEKIYFAMTKKGSSKKGVTA
ncbi:PTS glucitol/sorbitol transporter subunit IIC [Irregularibacter muris]|jgi:PTS system glucitol/sorbitol-specific IIC component|uniref:PTS glucitol/sorbitol transporter subunit IIC n=1 Tax=Irregularibacter muris TaxID=1796619 RepID=A0AAE3L332_9FIRM|nr:PTS glucitol/sorbitol transporter subunit IIC [Irregularibacter muris]MCR1897558.1 PTS glucitol/sorbitol transporter subunit IIC [Irregularibacter muris]